MTDTSVYLQPAFILQQQKFRETSLIMDVLTRDFGRISLLAKGVRKPKSLTAGLLQPFIPLAVSYFGKNELKTLTAVESVQPCLKLQGTALYSGFYINELISCFLHKDDPHPEVFEHYGECLSSLSEQETMEAALRNFELNLINHAGYGLQLNHVVNKKSLNDPPKKYTFDAEQGLIEDEDGKFSSETLQAISLREFSDPQVLIEAKGLMRTVIDVCLQGRPLKSRTIINKIIKHTKNA